MKIAIVFDGLGIGGIEQIGKNYVEIFEKHQYDITIFNLKPKQNTLESQFGKNHKIIHLPFSRKICPEQYAQLTKKIWFGRFLYPILFLFFSIICILYKLLVKMFIKESRDNYDLVLGISGHFNDLTFLSYNFLKTDKRITWVHGAIYSYLLISEGYYNLYKKIKNLIVSVDDSKEEVEMYNKIKFNSFKLYNPISFNSKYLNYDIIKNLKANYGKYMLVIARFSYPHKDHYTILYAFNHLVINYGLEENIVLIGDGPDFNRVKSFVDSFDEKVKMRIHFLGNRLDIINYYKSAYMLVHASVAGEGLPTVMIEALQNKLPMVVTDSRIGPREILRDNEFGLLCRIKDYEDMSKKIYKLYSDQELYDNFKLKSDMRIKDFYPETIHSKFISFVENL